MSARTIVAGNWKMHTEAGTANALLDALVAWSAANPGHVSMVVAPPFPFLGMAVEKAGSAGSVIIAAQNCHQEEQGAFTGEVGVPMLRSIGVQACIVGHSERRQYYGEHDAIIARKIKMLLKHGLQPIYCCGENREERESGRFREVVADQIRKALGGLVPAEIAKLVVAYEPVWAIGTGLTATPEQAAEMHAFIRAELCQLAGGVAKEVPVLYGGSCKPENATGIFRGDEVNGGLIGGAALVADTFLELVRIAGAVKQH
ncbi:MAG: triose-phosphate isomerase [Bacteroidetes bacterium]|nr:triose-phosphate isomerase [Bacteroidota bacterium]